MPDKPNKAKVPFDICPHPLAPLFNDKKDAKLVIEHLIGEMTGNMANTAELREYLRQASYVSLWFFLKYIAGFSGPYDKIDDGLHLEMANWRQSPACMRPGARGAGFVPRSYYKSTIWTHGANSWEIYRDPDIRIRLESNIFGKAQEFLAAIKNTFENNELLGWIAPEYMVPQGWQQSGNWSADRIVMPNRNKFLPDATVKIGSSSGASEGGHVDLYNSDDPVGQDDLDSMRNSSVEMMRKKRRFINNKTTLLDEAETDRVVLVGTRYSLDDIYDVAVSNAYEFKGFVVPEFQVREDGEWSIYNRLGEENGVFINPKKLNKRILDQAMEDDMWFAMTQLINYPQKAGLVEFHELPPKFAMIAWSDEYNDYMIKYEGSSNFGEDDNLVLLQDCDVVMSVDPAGTDSGIKATTSRSSIGIWARDNMDRVTRIFSSVGYYNTNTLFNEIFRGHTLYPGRVRATYVETNAMQKILLPLLREKQEEMHAYINPQPLPASGDKVARIRNAVGFQLSRGKLFLVRQYSREFLEEHAVFPMNQYKMDVLDESEKGITATVTPLRQSDIALMDRMEEEQELSAMENVFGY